MHELGLHKKSLALPHSEIRTVTIAFGDREFTIGDFTKLSTTCKFIALMPQWDFLDFIAAQAKAYPNFHLMMQTEAKDLLIQNSRIAGVLAKSPEGNVDICAGLTVAADGSHSILRDRSGLPRIELGAPFDVLWLSLPV